MTSVSTACQLFIIQDWGTKWIGFVCLPVCIFSGTVLQVCSVVAVDIHAVWGQCAKSPTAVDVALFSC
jgi:hypothetical protein